MSLLLLFGGGGGGGATNMTARTPTGLDGVMVAGSVEYTAQAESRAATISRSARVSIEWYTGAGASISVSNGSTTANATGSWTEHTITATSPATAVYASVIVEVQNVAAAEVHYFDKIGLFHGTPDDWTPGMGDGPVASAKADNLLALNWLEVLP